MGICPLGYFREEAAVEGDNNLCIECHSTCKLCFGGLDSNCQSCFEGSFLFNGFCKLCYSQCLMCNGDDQYSCTSCISSRTLTSFRECIDCDSNCKTCKSEAKNCTSCNANMYLLNGTCVSQCP